MGFFGKLFEKKICAICGEEIGLLGNRKLEDGNCCKECASKLSPWFNERRNSTVQEIKDQLDYREANKADVESFHVTRTLGRNTKVLLDEDARRFIVTSARNWQEYNPDVLKYDQVTGCDMEVDECPDEVKREVTDKEGVTRKESYNPRRYIYNYNFYMTIHVNHPYFDEMRFRLNTSQVEVRPSFSRPLMGGPRLEGSPIPPSLSDKQNDPDYAMYQAMGEEIKAALTEVRSQIREDIEAANAPKTAVTCPWCGAPTTPDANGCCEFCGGALDQK